MTDYVYIFKNALGHRKIGVTTDVQRRLAGIQTGNSESVEWEAAAECDKAYELEATMHTMFAHRRLTGEWFNVTFSEAWEGYERAWLKVFGHMSDPYEWYDPLGWPNAKRDDGDSIALDRAFPISPRPVTAKAKATKPEPTP